MITFSIPSIPASDVASIRGANRRRAAEEANELIAQLTIDPSFAWASLANLYLRRRRGLAAVAGDIRHQAIVEYDNLRSLYGRHVPGPVYGFVREQVNLAIMTWIESIVSIDINRVAAERDAAQLEARDANERANAAEVRAEAAEAEVENLNSMLAYAEGADDRVRARYEEALEGLLTLPGVDENSPEYQAALALLQR